MSARCWLASHAVHERGPMPACEGRLVRAHLLPKRLLKAEWSRIARGRRVVERARLKAFWPTQSALVWDERTWVWSCGGPIGSSGHHGALDHARTLRVPRQALPDGVEVVAGLLGLEWYLEREYGPLPAPGSTR